MSKPDITLFSTADWDNPFWTNKQHVAKALAEQGYRILYIESVGLRAPTATASDFGRIISRLKKALRAPRKVLSDENSGGVVWVLSPLVIPLQRFAVIRMLNGYLLRTSFSMARNWLKLKPDWLWTYNPLTTNLLNIKIYSKTIYHCVDAI